MIEGISDGAAATVRPAVAADAPDIARVHIASWQSTYRGMVPQPILDGLSVERRQEFWSGQLLEPGDTRIWVGERGGRIVGIASTGRPTDPELPATCGELQLIYLLADAQGLGLGRLMMEAAVGDLVGRGFTSAILWVLTANERARRFYEAGGWRSDGATNMLDFDGTPIEEVRYRLDLAAPEPHST